MNRKMVLVTLGKWLSAKVDLTITLTDWDEENNAYTTTRFDFRARNLIPDAIYTVGTIRQSFFAPSPFAKVPTTATPASHIVTNRKGRGKLNFTMVNPFPTRETDDAGVRVIGIGIGYKSDVATHGACTLRFGAGVDMHGVASSSGTGAPDFTDFVTVKPSEW